MDTEMTTRQKLDDSADGPQYLPVPQISKDKDEGEPFDMEETMGQETSNEHGTSSGQDTGDEHRTLETDDLVPGEDNPVEDEDYDPECEVDHDAENLQGHFYKPAEPAVAALGILAQSGSISTKDARAWSSWSHGRPSTCIACYRRSPAFIVLVKQRNRRSGCSFMTTTLPDTWITSPRCCPGELVSTFTRGCAK